MVGDIYIPIIPQRAHIYMAIWFMRNANFHCHFREIQIKMSEISVHTCENDTDLK